MRIGVIQASSQRNKNAILYDTVCSVAMQNEVVNLGCFEHETETYSYVEIALEIGLLVSSGALDFVVTGCSSGQGMMLACNILPNIVCGYCANPKDAFLFGRINAGNVISVPLGYGFGWTGEANLKNTLSALFDGPFGSGYPQEEAERKIADTVLLKKINSFSKRSIIEILNELDQDIVAKVLQREIITKYVESYSTNLEVLHWIKTYQDIIRV